MSETTDALDQMSYGMDEQDQLIVAEQRIAELEQENERLRALLDKDRVERREMIGRWKDERLWAQRAEQQLARVLAGECIAYDGADEPGTGSPNEAGCPHCRQARAEQQLAEARAVIRLIQQADGRCQVCAATMWGTHTSDCRLAAILKETP